MTALDIRQLRKTYPGGVQALKGIDLTVEQGDFFALLGPNGAGKSTTIGILSSLVNKTSGQVKIQGIDIDEHLQYAKSKLGIVPQEFNFSVFEKAFNIMTYQAGFYGVPIKRAKQNAEYYLKKLDLWHKRNQQARALSGGMKRRLMIARALVHEPEMLILDEPTAGVDIEIRRIMWDFLLELNQSGVTIILTTHYLEEAETLCDNVGIIDEGRIITCDATKNLVTQLDQESFICDLEHDLTTTPPSEAFSIKQLDARTLEIVKPKQNSLTDLFSWFYHNNIQVASMRNKANRLEELFFRLTQKDRSAS